MIWLRVAGAALFVGASVIGYSTLVRQADAMAPHAWLGIALFVGLMQATGLLLALYTRDRPNEPHP